MLCDEPATDDTDESEAGDADLVLKESSDVDDYDESHSECWAEDEITWSNFPIPDMNENEQASGSDIEIPAEMKYRK